jgi:O-methyltransferase involved in polyketide biosynthesis
MSISSPQLVEQHPSRAVAPSKDSYGLGKTPGQRGAEILAGVRADQSPTPETLALAKFSGRIVARLMMGMIRDKLPLNFTLARPMVIDGLIRRSLPEKRDDLVFVDIGAGLSPRGITLAREIPGIRVIEIDIPEVIEQKQGRLKRARNITIPSNLSWIAADLGSTPLPEVLGTQKAHVISSEGLLPYLEHSQIIRLGSWILECLHPGGAYIADVPLRSGVEAIQQLASFFSRQAGNWIGTVDDQEVARRLMLEAGFDKVETHIASDFTGAFNLPTPMVDVSCFIQATKRS